MPLANTNPNGLTKMDCSHLVSLGWSSDDEHSINIIELNNAAVTNELLKRYSSERSNHPVKIEQAQDEASISAIISNHDPDFAANMAKEAVLKKGLGVTFWHLTAENYHGWKETWNKRNVLINRWLDTNGTGVLRTETYQIIENDLFAIFKSSPLVRIDLSFNAIDLKKAQTMADMVLAAI